MIKSIIDSLVAIGHTLVDIVQSAIDRITGDDDDDNFPPMVPVAYG